MRSINQISKMSGLKYLALVLALCAPAGKAATVNPDFTVLTEVPVIQEVTEEAGGAAAIQSVLAYFGKEVLDQEDVMEAVGTDSQGTAIEDMVAFANMNGVPATQKSRVTISELQDQVRLGNPVLVELMAWSEDETSDSTYSDDWEDGRYAVVVGVDNTNVYLMDPSLAGRRGFIPLREFQERWHNLSSSGQREYQTALFFKGTAKRNPWERIF